jgi:hypothetical protein
VSAWWNRPKVGNTYDFYISSIFGFPGALYFKVNAVLRMIQLEEMVPGTQTFTNATGSVKTPYYSPNQNGHTG